MKYLLYLSSVIKSGSINTAARENGIKPTNFSKVINEFEVMTGYKLLQRTSKGVKPTFAGRKLYQLALSLEEKIADFDQMLHKPTTQGISLYLAENIQIDNLDDFCQQSTEKAVTIVNSPEDADLNILNYAPEDPSLEYICCSVGSLIKQKIWLVCRRQDKAVMQLLDFIISQLHL